MEDPSPKELFELLNQITQGDDKAATAFYRHFKDRIYAYIFKRLIVKASVHDEHAAEEVTHNTFLAAFNSVRKANAFRGDSKLTTWLCGIANHKVADWLELNFKQNKYLPLADVKEEYLQEIPDPDWNFVAKYVDEEDRLALVQCRNALPEKLKLAVFWFYGDMTEKPSIAFVASKLDIPEGTVKSRLNAAYGQLAKCMKNWFESGRYA